ncbi:PREDICTED: heavy [Prunus dulcis]|uniref:PREDICTED: heavy n=1 Tax=Prunus dulcis TaxID=3755 RepID=A0A5E4FUC8_PRUDU|nr:heavy metal-associated isoprenylated plant protein 47 [Prunus dulcis]VVA31027.1 PREDICTED: heavy [Prunus dulcis]
MKCKTKKIVMKVSMNCQKCQQKAFKIIAEADGVSFLGLGEERDIVVVIGEGVDACNLAKSLRKKFKTTDIISVADV